MCSCHPALVQLPSSPPLKWVTGFSSGWGWLFVCVFECCRINDASKQSGALELPWDSWVGNTENHLQSHLPWQRFPGVNLYHTVHSRIQGTTEGLVVSTEHTPQVGAAVAGTEASEVTCMNLCDHFSFLSNKAFAGRKQNKTNRSSYLVPGLMPYDKLCAYWYACVNVHQGS